IMRGDHRVARKISRYQDRFCHRCSFSRGTRGILRQRLAWIKLALILEKTKSAIEFAGQFAAPSGNLPKSKQRPLLPLSPKRQAGNLTILSGNNVTRGRTFMATFAITPM